jgi:ribosomal protein S18 acetylase RimI-like enzyme
MEESMYKIRYASVDDAEILGIIHAKSWQVAYKGIVPDEYLIRVNPEKRKRYYSKALSEGWERDALIFVDDEPAGLICIGKCRDIDKSDSYGEIWGIYLLSEFWNKGIGTYLLNWGINELYLQNYAQVSLWVLKNNANARKFYEKNGFTLDGTEREITLGKPLIECRYTRHI